MSKAAVAAVAVVAAAKAEAAVVTPLVILLVAVVAMVAGVAMVIRVAVVCSHIVAGSNVKESSISDRSVGCGSKRGRLYVAAAVAAAGAQFAWPHEGCRGGCSFGFGWCCYCCGRGSLDCCAVKGVGALGTISAAGIGRGMKDTRLLGRCRTDIAGK